MKRIITALLALVTVFSVSLQPPARAASDSKLIALTFDDGPGQYTNTLLDALAQRNARATFFMVGGNAAQYSAVVARAYNEGHEIANHTYSHPQLTSLSSASVSGQITRTNDVLDLACGSGTRHLVRPPYGDVNASVLRAIGAPSILWSVDTMDWKDRDANIVKNRILNNASDGAIILLHDIHKTTVDGAIAALDDLIAQGYELVTVSELYRRRGQTLENGVSYTRCNGSEDLGPVTPPVLVDEYRDGKVMVSMSAQEGVSIYYTLDGSVPTGRSSLYTQPVALEPGSTLRATAAFNHNGGRSAIAELSPAIAPAPSIQLSNDKLTLRNESNEPIYYTLDGTLPTERSNLYAGAVSIKRDSLIAAVTISEDKYPSQPVYATYSQLGHLFRDVSPADWFYHVVDEAVDQGEMNGLGDGIFAPEQTITKGEFLTLLYRFAGEPSATAEISYDDVEEGQWYTETVKWALATELTAGEEDGNFGLEITVRRSYLAYILYRYQCITQGVTEPGADLSAYADAADAPEWTTEAFSWAVAAGVIEGTGPDSLSPLDYTTRAECAAVLQRYADYLAPTDDRAEELSGKKLPNPADDASATEESPVQESAVS